MRLALFSLVPLTVLLTSLPTTSLATVNFFLGIVGLIQMSRIFAHQRAVKNGTAIVIEDVKEEVAQTKQDIKDAVKEVKA